MSNIYYLSTYTPIHLYLFLLVGNLGACRYEEFEGKYLDYVIELTDRKEAQNLTLWPNLDPKRIKPGEAMTIHDIRNGPDGQKRRFSMLHSLDQAKYLCDKLAPECAGVERENIQENYSLRRGGIPRHLVINGPRSPHPPTVPPGESKLRKSKFILPPKTAYLRYCPGESSHFRPHRPAFLCEDTEVKCPHSYSFDVHFSVSSPFISYIAVEPVWPLTVSYRLCTIESCLPILGASQ